MDEATPFLIEALRLDPLLADAHYNLGLVLRRRGEVAQAVERFREAVRLRPSWARALADLAWVLATATEAAFRSPTEAIGFAERALALTGGRDAQVLDVLAAAYAADGRFDRAIDTVETALRSNASALLAEDLQRRRELYRLRRPYVEGAR